MNFNTNRQPLATYIIIAITVVAYYFTSTNSFALSKYGLNINFIAYPAYWQPLTTMLTHGGLMHLGMNMVVLFQFGSIIEHFRGAKFTIFLYIVGGLLTSLVSFIYIYYFNNHVNLVGASGAISVLLGWMAQKDPYNRKGLIVAILVISFAPLLLGVSVAWYAHLIGFGVGWLVAKFLR
ncbi:MAG: rhomboid family intramembrane serine protease [Campylobacteraceae bacterium]